MDGSAQKAIATASLITVGVGTLNSFYKTKKPPSVRFLIGSGAAYVILSAIGEGEPEVAKALAFAVATTVVLGDGGGVLSYLNGHGETDTKKAQPDDNAPLTSSADLYAASTGPFTPELDTDLDEFQEDGAYLWPSSVSKIQPQQFQLDLVGAFPGV